MSSASLPRQAVDLDKFDRRNQGLDAKTGADPLAELARLVASAQKNGADPLAAMFSEPFLRQGVSGVSAAAAVHATEAETHYEPGGYEPGGYERAAYEEPYAPTPAHGYAPHGAAAPAYDPDEPFDNWSEGEYVAEAPAPKRSKKLLYASAAVIAAGCFGIAGTLALRSGASTNGAAPTILAASEPVKTQPAQMQGGDTSSMDTALLDKNVQTPPVRGVVSHDEKPMDVGQTVHTVRTVPTATANSQSFIPSPTDGAPADPAAAQNSDGFPERKIVKPVTVDVNGGVIRSDAKPVAAKPPAAASPAPVSDKANPSKPSPTKSAARVAPTPKSDDQKTDLTRTAALSKPKAPPHAQDDGQEADASDADASEPAAPMASGGYALQLAAAGSEQEARATASRLGQKYSAALGGRKPSFFKAQDKNVFRVRVSGLSREAAISACEKVKAAGGGCFVAKN